MFLQSSPPDIGVPSGHEGARSVHQWLCRELTSACKREAPPLPKDRKKGPAFKTADPQDLELNKMMANMKACSDSALEQHKM